MGRTSYTQSTSTSTRTFQSKPAAETKPVKAKKLKVKHEMPDVNIPSMSMPKSLTLPGIIIGILVALSLFLFVQYRQAQAKLTKPEAANAASSKQVTDTLGKVGKLVILPNDETPSVATVSDINKLKGQRFFVNAKVGDKVIVYTKAKQAILYRPSTNQIVTMAPVANPEQ